MKKVILAFDGKHFSDGVFKFANRLNERQPLLATGVFLPIVDHVELLYSLGTISGPLYAQEILNNDENAVEDSVNYFETLCKSSGIPYKIHKDLNGHVVTELKEETRYADLLLLSSELFYENLGMDTQEDYLAKVMHKAECPVVLIPEEYKFPESIILAYDGSADSVFAIKQFAYLFPELTSLKTILVYAGENRIPDLGFIKELTKCHFRDLSFFKLEADPKKYFDTWLVDNKSPMLVAGAYGRNLLSEFIKKSFITDVIRDHKVPIFIAHQ